MTQMDAAGGWGGGMEWMLLGRTEPSLSVASRMNWESLEMEIVDLTDGRRPLSEKPVPNMSLTEEFISV